MRLLRVKNYDAYVWRYEEDRFSSSICEFVFSSELLLELGPSKDSYLSVLSSSLGVVWIGEWELEEV